MKHNKIIINSWKLNPKMVILILMKLNNKTKIIIKGTYFTFFEFQLKNDLSLHFYL